MFQLANRLTVHVPIETSTRSKSQTRAEAEPGLSKGGVDHLSNILGIAAVPSVVSL
jgi:hypothetical protein